MQMISYRETKSRIGYDRGPGLSGPMVGPQSALEHGRTESAPKGPSQACGEPVAGLKRAERVMSGP